MYYMPGTVHYLGGYYYPHFTDDQTEALPG